MLRLFKQFYPIRNIFFIGGEGILIFLSVIISAIIFQGLPSADLYAVLCLKVALITLICQTCLYYNQLYDIKIIDNFEIFFNKLGQALGSSCIILSSIHLIIKDEIISNKAFIISLIFISISTASWRFLYNIILNYGLFQKKTALVGSSSLIKTIIDDISVNKDSGYHMLYFCPEEKNESKLKNNLTTIRAEKNFDDLYKLIKSLGIKMVVADTEDIINPENLENQLLKCRVGGIKVIDGNSFYEMATGKLNVNRIKPSWLIYSEGFKTAFHHRFLKRIIDYSLSLTLCLLVFPIVIFTAILIKIDSTGPVFYSQERMGKGKKNYKMYKFRSMTTDAEKKSGPAWSGANDMRVTRVGKYIRNWRIDELPQLINVLKGDMSFVGPRPEREFFVEKLEREIPYYGLRFAVKPGITGWAQVNYGYGASIADTVEKLNYDLYYIKNASIFMDIFTVFRTTKTVILGVENSEG